jgi:hypothetical protein
LRAFGLLLRLSGALSAWCAGWRRVENVAAKFGRDVGSPAATAGLSLWARQSPPDQPFSNISRKIIPQTRCLGEGSQPLVGRIAFLIQGILRTLVRQYLYDFGTLFTITCSLLIFVNACLKRPCYSA